MTNEEMHDRVDNDFAFHPATTAEKQSAHGSVRDLMRSVAHFIVDNVPPGREQSVALTELESVMHWCNSGIAKNSDTPGNERIAS